MKIIKTKLPEVFIIEPDVFSDARGWFLETFSHKRYEQISIKQAFVQDNVSFSAKNVLRGLHYQHPNPQGKLIQVLSGEVYDVAVDIRIGSPTFGQWIADNISASNHRQIYIPPGFAHGFCVLSDTAVFSYKCTEYYNAAADAGVIYNDPDINIPWPVNSPIVSKKDAAFPCLRDIPKDKLPKYKE